MNGQGLDHIDGRACAALFCAVLQQALSDAMHLPPDNPDQRSADAWLRAGGTWFVTVCDGAGVDPVQLRARYVGGRIVFPRHGSLRQPQARRISKRAAA